MEFPTRVTRSSVTSRTKSAISSALSEMEAERPALAVWPWPNRSMAHARACRAKSGAQSIQLSAPPPSP